MILSSYSLSGIIYNYISLDCTQLIMNAITKRQGETLSFVGFCDENAVVNDVLQIPEQFESNILDIVEFVKLQTSNSCMLVLILILPGRELIYDESLEEFKTNLQKEGIGFWLVNSEVERIKAVLDPVVIIASNKQEKTENFQDSVRHFFSDNGQLAHVIDGYQSRYGQIDMAMSVVNAIEEGHILSVEAGTGTGKSLAYLVPTVMAMKHKGCKVVISTNTINLQEQLLTKDIPLLSKAMDETINAVLIKGRSNYVCLRKLERFISEYSVLSDSNRPKGFDFFIKWVGLTKSGDRSEMKFEVEPELWDEVSSDSDMCLHSRCVFYPKCYFHKARKEMEHADVLVVNHHLLCSDVSVKIHSDSQIEHSVLPSYSIAVIDEAHNLPAAAQSYFGVTSSSRKMTRILNLLYKKESNRVGINDSNTLDFGILIRLREKVVSYRWSVYEIKSKILELIDIHLIPDVIRVKELGDLMYDAIYSFITKDNLSQIPKVLRVTDDIKENDEFKLSVISQVERFCMALSNLICFLESLLQNFSDDNEEEFYDFDVERAELGACIIKCRELRDSIEFIIQADDREFVYWIEAGKKKGSVVLTATPISVGEPIAQHLIDPLESCIMTSATMSVGRNFLFMRRELGLDELDCERLTEMIVPSPFDYRNQVLLGITTDTPEPNEDDYLEKVLSAIEKVVMASGGRAFVLFTSHKLLRTCADVLSFKFEKLGIRFLRQGQMPRHLLLKEFKSGDGSAVLFGTDSFWEGVDVPGEALSCVVLVRLPFSVPTDPVIQAKVEKIRDLGGNPFNDFYVPSAVLKFKQGFGRLIRTTEDTGVVVVLDSRICKKSYGMAFIEAIPECEMVTGNIEEIEKAVKGWFNN